MLNADTVRNELKQVIDPEVMLNIVDMGLVYDIAVNPDNSIAVTMTLTSPYCPMGPEIIQNVQRVAGAVDGAAGVDVNIVWNPPWSPAMFSDDLKAELREMGMEVDEDMIPDHTPQEEAPADPPAPVAQKKKRGGILGWLFGR